MDKNYVTQAQLKEEFTGFRKEINDDFKLHTAVLVEEFKNQNKLLAEQMSTLLRNQQTSERVINLIFNEVGDINIKITAIMEMLEQKVDITDHQALEHRVSTLEAHL